LRNRARRTLSMFLNLKSQVLLKVYYMPDFTGFAELIGYEYLETCNFERSADPMGTLLDDWGSGTRPNATVGKLCKILQELGRVDVLTSVLPVIENDIHVWEENQKQLKSYQIVQDETVSQSSRSDTDHNVDQFKYMTNGDVAHGAPQYYDAFVCHSIDDIAFVKEMISHLESSKHNLKLCVPERDMLAGGSYHTISARLIEERCKKMVAIVSPNFLKSPQCDFQIKFAHAVSPGSRSKKVIPVLKELCQLPSILRHITICDFTKGDLKEWFWDRLARAIQMPVDTSPATDALDRQRLSQVHFKIESSPSSSNIWPKNESETSSSSNNSHSSTRSSNNSASHSSTRSAIHSSRC
ncbi:LOW QUALITY PROTEIN: myeloid differentiation primary response protein MyD88-like, partial [Liolophura sinensis]|uniref:LOW QUALITY PROTEIN: myeloid differentiation primary response protein MyD88-like n=1 Tax=Liolophura sinensis TaxID=3198878 RepID=UPI0031588FB8